MRHSTVSVVPPHSTDAPRSSWLAWCRGRAPLLVAVAFFVAMFWPFMRKGVEGEWRRCFLRAAYRLQAGQIIHRPYEVNTYAYPPAMAMLAVPLAQLPFRWSLGGWYLTNVAAMVAVVICAWRLTGGPPLNRLAGRAMEDGLPSPSEETVDGLGRPSSDFVAPPTWGYVYWLGLFLASRFLIAPLENQQFDVVITAVLYAGCLALWRGRDTLAGLALGMAAAMKCTPLLFFPYLVWRGKWRAAVLMLFAVVAINRLPDFLWPRADGGSYLGDWVGTFLIQVAKKAPGVWDSDLILNQSLSGLVNRLLQSGLPLTVSQLPSALASLPAATVAAIRLLTYGLSGALLLVTAWSFGARGQTPCVRSIGGTAVPWCELRTGIEASALVCLMLLLSPMSSKAHYVVLALPCMLLARAVVEGRCDWKRWLLPLAVLGPLTAKSITGKMLGDLMLAWGFPTWFVLVLLAAMWQLRRECNAEAKGTISFGSRLPRAA